MGSSSEAKQKISVSTVLRSETETGGSFPYSEAHNWQKCPFHKKRKKRFLYCTVSPFSAKYIPRLKIQKVNEEERKKEMAIAENGHGVEWLLDNLV